MELQNTITLKNVRISFIQTLWKTTEERPKHAAHAIMSPDDPQVKQVEALIAKAASECPKWQAVDPKTKKPAWQTVLAGLKAQDRTCLHSGDTKAQYEGYAGNVFVSGNNDAKVLVVGRDGKTPVPEGEVIYSGARVNMNVQIWAQDNKFGKRINATLRWVQYRAPDDAFTGTAPATTDEVPDISAEVDEDAMGGDEAEVPLA
jgi:Protein of unknown function (DUF2815)